MKSSRLPEYKAKGFSLFCTAFWFLLLLIVILFAKMALFAFYRVTSGSMESTLLINDFLLVDKLSYGARTPNLVQLPFISHSLALPSFKLPCFRKIKNGDIVVFRDNNRLNTHLLVKRCMATAGQTIEIRQKKVLVNGINADSLLLASAGEELFQHQDAITLSPQIPDPSIHSLMGINRDNFGPLKIPEGTIFVLGDNRDCSFDSRYFGVVEESAVVGRAVLIYYSSAASDTIDQQQINWRRLGRFIR